MCSNAQSQRGREVARDQTQVGELGRSHYCTTGNQGGKVDARVGNSNRKQIPGREEASVMGKGVLMPMEGSGREQ